MEIHMDMGAGKLWLSQKSYVEKILNKIDMSNSKVVSNPLANHFKLTFDQYLKSESEIEYVKGSLRQRCWLFNVCYGLY
jgi:hypothetical protein